MCFQAGQMLLCSTVTHVLCHLESGVHGKVHTGKSVDFRLTVFMSIAVVMPETSTRCQLRYQRFVTCCWTLQHNWSLQAILKTAIFWPPCMGNLALAVAASSIRGLKHEVHLHWLHFCAPKAVDRCFDTSCTDPKGVFPVVACYAAQASLVALSRQLR